MSGDFTVTSIMTVVLCPATASALRENTGLTKLKLQDCGIDAKGISHLEQALRVNTTLTVLDLSFNPVDSQGAEHLGKFPQPCLVLSGSLQIPSFSYSGNVYPR